MRPGALRTGAAFLVGFAGWLVASAAQVDGWWVLAVLVALGAIAGIVAPQPIHLLSLWLGVLAATYPVALALGVFAFLGEGLEVLLLLFLVVAAAGFATAVAAGRWATGSSRAGDIGAP